MSEALKSIVAELNKPPFSRGYSLISFDSLEGLSLLQVLTDVLAELEPTQKVDVREEPPESTAMRIFEMLRIFRYSSQEEDQSSFRQGVVEGKKRTIQPMLSWILKKMPELKERAYLARYLVKVEIPPEFLVDSSVGDFYEQYLGLMETFKDVHKQLTAYRNSEFNTSDVKKDIESMESEKEQLLRRVEKLKKKASLAANSETMLVAARNLRSENDRSVKIHRQKQDQRNLIVQMDQRTQRLQQQLKDLRQSSIGMSPQSLLQKLEEETSTNSYLVREKLPQELKSLKSEVEEVMKVALEPAMGQSDLDAIQQKIKSTNVEINKLLEKKMMTASSDGKMGGGELYRQQASIVKNKKESVAEQLNRVRNEVHKMEQECNAKRSHMSERSGGESYMSNDELRKLAQQLRQKHPEFKEKKKELTGLKVENSCLTRTEELLDKQSSELQGQLAAYERKMGVTGYHETQDALENVSSVKSNLDEEKAKKLQDISLMVQQLNNKIDRKKQILVPIIEELRPLRNQMQELTERHKEKKAKYESVQAGYESNWSNLEREVTGLQEEVNSDESRSHQLRATLRADEALAERANQENKSFSSSANNEQGEKKRSLREIMSKKIQEQEQLGRQLRERQKGLGDNQESNAKQSKMWKDLERLMQMKLKLKLASSPTRKPVETKQNRGNSNRLVL